MDRELTHRRVLGRCRRVGLREVQGGWQHDDDEEDADGEQHEGRVASGPPRRDPGSGLLDDGHEDQLGAKLRAEECRQVGDGRSMDRAVELVAAHQSHVGRTLI